MHIKQSVRSSRRAKLLNREPIPVRTDVFLHGLSPCTLESLRRAIEQGLIPTSLDFAEDGTIVTLRFTKPEYRGTFPNASGAGPSGITVPAQ